MKIIALLILLISPLNVHSQMVVEVQDGDTFQLNDGSKVRMIGINSPEKKDIYGVESKEYLEKLILNKSIVLQKDLLSKDVDRYQRKLRYAYLNGVDVNLLMIEHGYAFAYLTYNFTKNKEYKAAQLSSKKARNGMWGDGNVYEIPRKQGDEISNKMIVIIICFVLILLVGGYPLMKK